MGKFRKLSVVLLLAFVLLCCIAPSVFSVNKFTFELQFYDKPGTTPTVYSGPAPLYAYIEVEKQENDEPKTTYWSYAQFTPSESSYTVELDKLWSTNQTGDENDALDYDSSVYSLVESENSPRIYVDRPTYSTVHPDNIYIPTPNDTISGYEFLSSSISEDKTQISISIKEAYEKDFFINLNFDPDSSTQISQEDHYYIFVTVKHKRSGDTYYLTPLTSNTLQYHITEWKDLNGSIQPNEKFTGNEKSVSVKILKSKQDPLIINDAAGGNNYIVIAENSTIKNYRVTYDNNWTSRIPKPTHNQTSDHDEFFYTITLTKVDASNDYTYKSILGPGVHYGITANSFEQKGHIQSNFATNLYIGNGHVVEVDLASSMGSIIMSDVTPNSDNSFINIGGSHNNNLIIYTRETNDEEKVLKEPRNFVTVVTSSSENIKNNYVDPIINYGQSISNQLLQHPATVVPEIIDNKVLIDTTTFPDGATIYIDADDIAGYLDTDQLRIKKQKDQVLVFNFKSTENLTIKQFLIQYPNMEEYSGVVNGDGWINTVTPKEINQEKNKALDEVARHIVWNCSSVNDLSLEVATGMFLVPRTDSITDIKGTSSGWIIAAGSSKNSGGEWHFTYQDLEDIDSASLTAKKTVNSKIPTTNEKFTFKIEQYKKIGNSNEYDWQEIGSIDNDGGAISFTVKETEDTLSEGWNAYKITETGKSSNNTNDKNYNCSTAVYYATVNYRELKNEDPNSTTKIKAASLPKYYQDFNETIFKENISTGATAESVGFSTPVTTPTFTNTESASGSATIQIQKTLEDGAVWPSENGTPKTASFTITCESENCTSLLPNPAEVSQTQAGPVSFSPITYTEQGEYTYKITESNDFGNTWTNDGPVYAKVTVNSDLTTSVSYSKDATFTSSANSISITNRLRKNASVQIAGTKKVTRNSQETDPASDEQWNFTISSGDPNAPMPSDCSATPCTPVTVVTNTGAAFTFPAIVFTPEHLGSETSKTFNYAITETAIAGTGSPVNIAIADPYTITFSVKLSLDENGDMKAEVYSAANGEGTLITDTEGKFIVGGLVNTEISNASVKFEVGKSINTWPSGTTSFTFKIEAEGEDEVLTNSTAKLANQTTEIPVSDTTTKASFGPISFDLRDDGKAFQFKIDEVIPQETKGVTYDDNVYHITIAVNKQGTAMVPTVTVTDNKGTVTPSVRQDQDAIAYILNNFQNTYNATGSVTLNVEKTMQGNHWPASGPHSFTFTIDGKDDQSEAKLGTEFNKTVTISSTGTPVDNKISDIFDTINFTLDDVTATKTTPYQFEIKESAPTSPYDYITAANGNHYYLKDGIYYYADPIDVSIKLTDNGDGKINVIVNGSQITDNEYNAEVVNAYHEDGTIQLMVTKSFGEGKPWPKGRNFEFTLSGTDVKSNKLLQDNSATIHNAIAESFEPASFGSIKISEADEGTYTFKITETVPNGATDDEQGNKVYNGVTYKKPIEKTFSITFSDAGDGNIFVSEEGHPEVYTDHTGQPIGFTVESFTNEYEAEGYADIRVKKALSGAAWPEGDDNTSVEFSLEAVNDDKNTPELSPAHKVTFTEAENDFKAFAPIQYTLADAGKEYHYKITETSSFSGSEWSVVDSPIYVKVIVGTDNGNGELTGSTVTYYKDQNFTTPTNETNGPVITNKYTAEGTVQINVTKAINYWPKSSDSQDASFTFTIADVENQSKIDTTDNKNKATATKSNPDAQFPAISFTQDDIGKTYTFKVTEDRGDLSYVNYSGEEYSISFKVTDNHNGTLGIEELQVKNKAGETVNGPSSSGTNGVNTISLGNNAKFTNIYTSEGSVNLAVNKTWKGNHQPPEGVNWSIGFSISGMDANAAAKLNSPDVTPNITVTRTSPDASKSFGPIKFTQDDLGDNGQASFNFTVTEILPTGDGVTEATVNGVTYKVKDHIYYPANNTKTVTVFLQDDGMGNIYPTVTSNDTVTAENGYHKVRFENDYQEYGKFKLNVKKSFNTVFPTEQTIIFRLKGKDVAAQTLLGLTGDTYIQQGADYQNQEITFGEFEMPASQGEYTFIVTEVVPDEATDNKLKGITYNTPVSKEVLVKFVQDPENQDNLIPKIGETQYPDHVIDLGTFTNKYDASGEIQISVKKTIDNWPKNRTFTFTIADDDMNFPKKINSQNSSVTIDNKDELTKSFEKIIFSLDDLKNSGSENTYLETKEFKFTISETVPSGADENGIYQGVKYDRTNYFVIVTVSDNGDGTLKTETIVTGGNNYTAATDTEPLTITFNNTYNAEGTAELKVQKEVIGAAWPNDVNSLTFTLSDIAGTTSQTKTLTKAEYDAGNKEISFEPINYGTTDADKQFTYKISETGSFGTGWSKSEDILAYVNVSPDDGSGSLTTTVTYKPDKEGQTPSETNNTITNTYNATGRLMMKSSKRIAGAPDGSAQSHELPFELWHKADHVKFKAGDTTVEPLISRVITILDNETLEFDYPVHFTLESNPADDPSVNPHDVIHVESLPDAVEANKAIMNMVNGKRVYTVNYVLDERTVVDRELNPPDQTYDIIVEIEDEGDGTLHVNSLKYKDINKPGEAYTEVTNPAADIMIGTFLNRERHDSVTELLIGTKILEGRDLTAADNGKWFVTISSDDENAPLPQEKTVPVVIKEENGTLRGSFTFGSITFEPEHMGECIPDAVKGYICGSKDYHYTLTESGTEEGIINGPALKFIIRASEGEKGHVQADFVDEAGNVLTMQQVLAELTLINRTAEQEKTPEGPTFYRIRTMPETGFSALKPTVLGEQPKALNYKPLAWTLEIPSLDLVTDIVEVPSADGTYPVTWLGSSAGLLEGFGLPGGGHSVLTGHNHLNTMEAGPFALLQKMGIGDRIFVLDPEDQMQIFTVYANEKIAETDIRGLQRIAERFDDSLTLITCEDERIEGGYANRRIIAAKPVDR